MTQVRCENCGSNLFDGMTCYQCGVSRKIDQPCCGQRQPCCREQDSPPPTDPTLDPMAEAERKLRRPL